MAESRDRQAWAHTSAVLALTANANRDPKKKPTPFKASDFNPHAKKWERRMRKARTVPGGIEMLKMLLPAGRRQAGVAQGPKKEKQS